MLCGQIDANVATCLLDVNLHSGFNNYVVSATYLWLPPSVENTPNRLVGLIG